MKIKYDVEFPCGYKLKVYVETGLFDFASIDTKEEIKECPLHGKNCPINLNNNLNENLKKLIKEVIDKPNVTRKIFQR